MPGKNLHQASLPAPGSRPSSPPDSSSGLSSPWSGGFLLVGNHPTLDFLNTRPVLDDGPTELLPDFPAVLRWFQATGLLTPQQIRSLQKNWANSPEAARALQYLRALREKLRRAVTRWEQGKPVPSEMINTLNRLLAESPMLTRLSPLALANTKKLNADSAPLTLERWFDPHRPSDLLAPIAFFAAQLFAEADFRRVRQCGQCVLHFLDTSKKGTRRWCSMQLCGNRIKVAAYAQRQRDLQD